MVKIFNDRLLTYFSLYIALIFVSTIIGGYLGYNSNSEWVIGDWLINYQGGFVRRGFLGELIYRTWKDSGVKLGLVVLCLQYLCYSVFILCSVHLLLRQDSLKPFIFLIFSPFIFSFQVHAHRGGFRKEIIYIALLSFFAWSIIRMGKKNSEIVYYLILSIYPLVILSHETLAVFLPYIIALYFLHFDFQRNKVVLTIFLLMPSVAAFILSFMFNGTELQVNEICKSLAGEAPSKCNDSGAIQYLSNDLSFGLRGVKEDVVLNNYFATYALAIVLSLFAFVPILSRFKSLYRTKVSLGLVVISFFGTLPLFVVAIDWGRFIYVHLVSLFIIGMISHEPLEAKYWVLESLRYSSYDRLGRAILVTLFVAVIICYTFLWYIPHCCKSSIFH